MPERIGDQSYKASNGVSNTPLREHTSSIDNRSKAAESKESPFTQRGPEAAANTNPISSIKQEARNIIKLAQDVQKQNPDAMVVVRVPSPDHYDQNKQRRNRAQDLMEELVESGSPVALQLPSNLVQDPNNILGDMTTNEKLTNESIVRILKTARNAGKDYHITELEQYSKLCYDEINKDPTIVTKILDDRAEQAEKIFKDNGVDIHTLKQEARDWMRQKHFGADFLEDVDQYDRFSQIVEVLCALTAWSLQDKEAGLPYSDNLLVYYKGLLNGLSTDTDNTMDVKLVGGKHVYAHMTAEAVQKDKLVLERHANILPPCVQKVASQLVASYADIITETRKEQARIARTLVQQYMSEARNDNKPEPVIFIGHTPLEGVEDHVMQYYLAPVGAEYKDVTNGRQFIFVDIDKK